MKLLVIRFSSIGDIVLTTPVLRVLKTQLNAEVHFATKKSYSFVLEANPHIDKFHFLDESLLDLIKRLKKERFDFVVDLHNNLRTKIICLSLGRPFRSFPKLNFHKWLWINFKVNLMPKLHIVDRYFEATVPLGIKPDGLGLDYHIPQGQDIEEFTAPFVAFVIGGQHFTKRLPVEKVIEAIKKIPFPVLLLGGKEDSSNGQIIASHFFEKQVINLCGRYNFHQSASLVKQSLAVLTNDTGLMHVAAAFGKKTIVFWGNTSPMLGMYPYKTKHINLENNPLSCRPCSKIGFNRCPKKHFKCMNELALDVDLTSRV